MYYNSTSTCTCACTCTCICVRYVHVHCIYTCTCTCTCMVSHRNSRIFLCVMQLAMQNTTRLRKYFFLREIQLPQVRFEPMNLTSASSVTLILSYLHVLVHGSELFSEKSAVPGELSSVALLCLSRVSVVCVYRDCTYVHHSWSRAASISHTHVHVHVLYAYICCHQ